MEQNSQTRHALARLDVIIVHLAEQELASRTAAQALEAHAGRLAELKDGFMGVRDELRPLLDSSAPEDYPYDHHRRPK